MDLEQIFTQSVITVFTVIFIFIVCWAKNKIEKKFRKNSDRMKQSNIKIKTVACQEAFLCKKVLRESTSRHQRSIIATSLMHTLDEELQKLQHLSESIKRVQELPQSMADFQYVNTRFMSNFGDLTNPSTENGKRLDEPENIKYRKDHKLLQSKICESRQNQTRMKHKVDGKLDGSRMWEEKEIHFKNPKKTNCSINKPSSQDKFKNSWGYKCLFIPEIITTRKQLKSNENTQFKKEKQDKETANTPFRTFKNSLMKNTCSNYNIKLSSERKRFPSFHNKCVLIKQSFNQINKYEKNIKVNKDKLRSKEIKYTKCTFITDIINSTCKKYAFKENNYQTSVPVIPVFLQDTIVKNSKFNEYKSRIKCDLESHFSNFMFKVPIKTDKDEIMLKFIFHVKLKYNSSSQMNECKIKPDIMLNNVQAKSSRDRINTNSKKKSIRNKKHTIYTSSGNKYDLSTVPYTNKPSFYSGNVATFSEGETWERQTKPKTTNKLKPKKRIMRYNDYNNKSGLNKTTKSRSKYKDTLRNGIKKSNDFFHRYHFNDLSKRDELSISESKKRSKKKHILNQSINLGNELNLFSMTKKNKSDSTLRFKREIKPNYNGSGLDEFSSDYFVSTLKSCYNQYVNSACDLFNKKTILTTIEEEPIDDVYPSCGKTIGNKTHFNVSSLQDRAFTTNKDNISSCTRHTNNDFEYASSYSVAIDKENIICDTKKITSPENANLKSISNVQKQCEWMQAINSENNVSSTKVNDLTELKLKQEKLRKMLNYLFEVKYVNGTYNNNYFECNQDTHTQLVPSNHQINQLYFRSNSLIFSDIDTGSRESTSSTWAIQEIKVQNGTLENIYSKNYLVLDESLICAQHSKKWCNEHTFRSATSTLIILEAKLFASVHFQFISPNDTQSNREIMDKKEKNK